MSAEVRGGASIQNTLAKLRKRLTDRKAVYVGVPAGSGSYEDGASIAVIGAVQEFGSADGHIPERSFLRAPLRAAQADLRNVFKNQMPEVVEGNITIEQLLDQVGFRAVGISQQAISAGIAPENAESTKRRKGSSNPLIDTGRLFQSITHEVRDEGVS